MYDGGMSLFIRNVNYGPKLKLSGWRKIAMGTWSSVGDPSVYGVLELDADPALAWLEKMRGATPDLRLTLTHLIGKVVADSIRAHPEINCVLRHGQLYPRKDVDVFFQIAPDKKSGTDLSGTVIRKVDTMSVAELARVLNERATAVREKRDNSYTKMKNLAEFLPGLLSHSLLSFGEFLLHTLNLWTPLLGAPRDAFGSVMVTNVGSLGLEEAFAPLVPYSRVPILIASGAVREKPVVKNGQIVIGRVLKLCVTFDHRLIDGVHAGKMAATVKKLFENPT